MTAKAIPVLRLAIVLVLLLPNDVTSFLSPPSFTKSLPNKSRLTPQQHHYLSSSTSSTTTTTAAASSTTTEVDIAIIGSGIGGLSAGAILNTLYNKTVAIYESHYLPGGCAHAFDRYSPQSKQTFTFDSGPTIVLGCSRRPYNPLRQVLNAINLDSEVEWIPYSQWGMLEHPSKPDERAWTLELGPEAFENGPLRRFGGDDAVDEFRTLRSLTAPLVAGAVAIPAMAMRSDDAALVPLLRYFGALVGLIRRGDAAVRGTFAPYMDGPLYTVKNKWLRDWLDALAFSLSGLPASRTAAAAMAYVLYDMHREGASLDYPRGGLGRVIDALVKGVEQGENDSRVFLKSHVEGIDTTGDGRKVTGLRLRDGRKVRVREGVICNAPLWSLAGLLSEEARSVMNDNQKWTPSQKERIMSWSTHPSPTIQPRTSSSHNDPSSSSSSSLLDKCEKAEMTGSFLHLHLALNATNLDLSQMEAHYTVMDRGLSGDNTTNDGPCGELNMIAVSNPCKLDATLSPPGTIVVHAYGAGNEPYDIWTNSNNSTSYSSDYYQSLKQSRAAPLYRAVRSLVPDLDDRIILSLVGSPLTHERFLRRPKGTYGAATEDYLPNGQTPIDGLVLCGDGVFPGIGVPSVALSGASAAHAFVGVWEQWRCLDGLKERGLV